MSFFRDHDPSLDEPEDHSTAFDRWLASWVWTRTAKLAYLAFIVFGIISGLFKWIAGAIIVVAFIYALLIMAALQQWKG